MPGCLCGVQLGIFYLHTSVLLLLILKTVNRLLSHLVSCSLLASSLFLGGFIGVTVSFATGFNFYLVLPGFAASASVPFQGF